MENLSIYNINTDLTADPVTKSDKHIESNEPELQSNNAALTEVHIKALTSVFEKTKELLTGKYESKQLMAFSGALMKPKRACETTVTRYIRKQLLRDISTIIVISDGDGKSSAMDYFDSIIYEDTELFKDDDQWCFIKNVASADDLIHELFPLSIVYQPNNIERFFKIALSKEGLSCGLCIRKCRLVPVNNMPGFWRDDDVWPLIWASVSKISGACPVQVSLVNENLNELKSVCIEIPPQPQISLISIIRSLANGNRRIILLSNKQSAEKLQSMLPDFKLQYCPEPNGLDLLNIYKGRLKEAEMPVSPIEPTTLNCLISISQNPGEFIDRIDGITNLAIEHESDRTLPAIVVTDYLKNTIDQKTAYKIVLMHLVAGDTSGNMFVKVEDVKNELLSLGFMHSSVDVGIYLSDLGFDKKHTSSGNGYIITPEQYKHVFRS